MDVLHYPGLLPQSYIKPVWPVPENIVALTSTRLGGVSQSGYAAFNLADHVGDAPDRVAINHQLLAQGLTTPLKFQWLQQVHGIDVVEVDGNASLLPADAAFSRAPAVACCVLTADCLPILLTTTDGDVVAAVHAGWRGLAAGVVEQTLQAMQVSSDKVLAWLGPAIGQCHFEVGAEVRDSFLAAVAVDQQEYFDHLGFTLIDNSISNPVSSTVDLAVTTAVVSATKNSKYMANLYAIADYKLQQLGVSQIHGGDFCTYCNEQQFYSHRREAPCGRMVSLIYIRP